MKRRVRDKNMGFGMKKSNEKVCERGWKFVKGRETRGSSMVKLHVRYLLDIQWGCHLVS